MTLNSDHALSTVLVHVDWSSRSGFFQAIRIGTFFLQPDRQWFYFTADSDLFVWHRVPVASGLGPEWGCWRWDSSGKGDHMLIPASPGETLTDIRGLHVDQMEQVWVQTPEGLFCYRNREKGLFKVLEAGATTHSLALNPVEPLEEDQEGFIWYGSFGDGVLTKSVPTLVPITTMSTIRPIPTVFQKIL